MDKHGNIHYTVRIKEKNSDHVIETEAVGRWTRKKIIAFYGLEEPDVEWYTLRTEDPEDIHVGKTITYRDGWTGETSFHTIRRITWDETRSGYRIDCKGTDEFYFLHMDAYRTLVNTGRYIKTSTIDGCAVTDIHTIEER